ncbi:TonB family protein [Mesorhizobium sp. CGMCC 1.15528]|uniref:TonB family protein n=1 Tax=Mesorhizobium zhangyense TaxID=1776730 RepID=A0A7C9RBL9_9HYPH|nr:energy transducer TonB [Mesorhizobium zhangyense]NGN45080.1 TonB family protein [Mesorhizobium zhangyense]
MTARADTHIAFPALPSLREVSLWAAAGLVVLTTHASVAYYLSTRPPELSAEAAEPAMMIELAPLPMAVPEEVEPENLVAEAPNQTIEPVDEQQEEMAETPVEEPVQPDEVEPIETPEPETVTEAEPVEEIEPEVVEAITPEVAIPLPQPRPVVREEPKKPVEKKKEVVKKDKPTPKRQADVAEKETKPAERRVVQKQASTAPSVSPAKWSSKVQAWVARCARRSSTKESGTVWLTFRIDVNGNVNSARIARSSGSSELDQATVDLVGRCSGAPVPPEPSFAKKPFSLPVQFKTR